jgi:hypothetical protein
MNSNAFQTTSNTQLQSQLPAILKMTVLEYLCATWKEFYRSERAIKRIIEKAGIPNQAFLKVHQTSIINDDRYSVIADTLNTNTCLTNRIIIDVIKGEPTWEQMMDITYGIGSDCNTRIIICNIGSTGSCYLDWTISDFVLMSNEHGLSTYVLSANLGTDGVEHEVIERDEIVAVPMRDKFPSKYEMQRTKFMIDYHARRDFEPRPRHFQFNEWPSDGLTIFTFNNQLEYGYPFWEPDGVFMFIAANGPAGQQELSLLLRDQSKELKKRLGNFEVEYDDHNKLPKKISAKILDVPFSEYLFSDEDERELLIRKILDLDPYDDDEFISDLIEQ